MSTIVLRSVKGSGLTNNEIDANFTNLNTDKIEATQTVTLTNKTLALGSNTVSGTTAQFNTALSDGDFATLAGTETLTNKTLTSPDINGGTIDGAVIGGSSASAVYATTLETTSTPTFNTNVGYIGKTGSGNGGNWRYKDDTGTSRWLSGLLGSVGAVNWSIYDIVNSKYVITVVPNSAQMDLTTTGLAVTGAISTTGYVKLADTYDLRWGDGSTFIAGNAATDILQFATAGVECMRLDASGNLGLGVTPSGSEKALILPDTLSIKVALNGQVTGNYYAIEKRAAVAGGDGAFKFVAGNTAAGEFVFSSGGTNKAVLDASGNLGLGVTPSAWGVGLRTLAIGPGSSLTNANSFTQTWLASNAHYSTAWTYTNSAEASHYEQASGTHKWYTAPSGTAGNAITFTERMNLSSTGLAVTGALSATGALTTAGLKEDASGNLGLGVTPSAWTAYKALQIGARLAIIDDGGGTTGNTNNAYYVSGWKYLATGQLATKDVSSGGVRTWSTAPSGTAGAAVTWTDAMSLDASSNLTVTGGITTGSYTVATRPAHAAGRIIHVTDGGAGAVFQGSAGGAWVNLG